MVVVPDRQLSLAIGKEGQNARLAARLAGWRLDIKGLTEWEEIKESIQAELAAKAKPEVAVEEATGAVAVFNQDRGRVGRRASSGRDDRCRYNRWMKPPWSQRRFWTR